MIHLSTLLRFPMIIKDRKQSLIFLKTNIIDITNDTTLLLSFNTINSSNSKIHKQIFNILEPHKRLNSKIEIYCDCESFKYEFSKQLYLNNSLHNSNFFDDIFKVKKPSKTNIVSGCKHIINCAMYISKHPEIFKGY